MTNEEWLERDKVALASVLSRVTEIVAVRGQGSWLWDVEGNKYLDFASGIAANSTGHCHQKIVDAIKLQAETLIHTSVTTHHTLNIQLAEKLGELCPFFEQPQIFMCNSGAEAVDGSLKLARYVTGRSGIIAFQEAFHGRTVAATSLTTAKTKYHSGYSPYLPYVYHAPYNEFSTTEASKRLANLFKDPLKYKIGAIIVEPVLGEGGYVVPNVDWLQELRYTCDEQNALLIFDEVQTCFRTGYPFAAETFGVTPDVILFAKGIASGLPLGGIIAPKSTMDKWPEGTHGSTFGGNPVSCAAALATLDILEPLYGRVRWMGKAALYRLAPWKARGIGYMIGIPLGSKKEADTVQQRCLEAGILVLTCGANGDVIRLIPPLTATDEEWGMALDILEETLNEVLINTNLNIPHI